MGNSRIRLASRPERRDIDFRFSPLARSKAPSTRLPPEKLKRQLYWVLRFRRRSHSGNTTLSQKQSWKSLRIFRHPFFFFHIFHLLSTADRRRSHIPADRSPTSLLLSTLIIMYTSSHLLLLRRKLFQIQLTTDSFSSAVTGRRVRFDHHRSSTR